MHLLPPYAAVAYIAHLGYITHLDYVAQLAYILPIWGYKAHVVNTIQYNPPGLY